MLIGLTACTTSQHYATRRDGRDGPPSFYVDEQKIHNPVPKKLAPSKYGNPKSYRIGKHYYHVRKTAEGYCARGIASWYGTKFHNRLTASGERYNLAAMTAAHPTLPIPSYVHVTNLTNGKKIIVKINDRGPFAHNRIIDLSYVAAKKLDMLKKGTAYVEVRALTGEKKPIIVQKHRPQFLQIASFKQRKNAQTAAFKLKQLTHTPVLIIARGSKQNLNYQVVLGPTQISQRLLSDLKYAGFDRPLLKRYE